MSLTVVNHPRVADKTDMLETLDALREKIISGELVAFAAVAINEQDETYAFQATERHVTVLRQIGAVSYLLHCIQTGEV